MGIEVAVIAITIAATVMSAVQAQQQASNQAKQQKFQAQVAANNQILANRAASEAIVRGEIAASRQRQASADLLGRQRAALAGSGVLVGQDSALKLVADTGALGELDALTIKDNAAREALNFRIQGQNFGAEQSLRLTSASNITQAGNLKVAGTLLSGFGSVALKWQAFNKVGIT